MVLWARNVRAPSHDPSDSHVESSGGWIAEGTARPCSTHRKGSE
jgi:hypothetical protein